MFGEPSFQGLILEREIGLQVQFCGHLNIQHRRNEALTREYLLSLGRGVGLPCTGEVWGPKG